MITSFGRLKIVKKIDDSETQSYLVFDPERQGDVLLHVLPGQQNGGNAAFLQRLERGLEASRRIVLSRGDLFGVPYVITECSPAFTNLTNLLEEFPSKNKPAAEISTTAEPGEFTRLFLAQSLPAASLPAQLTPQPAPQPPPPQAKPPQPIPPAPAIDPDKTKLFDVRPKPKVDPKPIPKPQGPALPTSSEAFNQYFNAPLGKGVDKVDFSSKARPAPPEPKKPGDFTQMFGRPFSRGAKPKPAERREEVAGATGVFSNRSSSPTPIHQPAGESEYTQIIKGPRSMTAFPAAEQPKTPTADKSQAKPPSPIIIFALLGVLLVVAVSLVLYFVLKS